MNTYGYTLKHANDNFKKYREIVLAAIFNDGYALQFAHDDIKKDREVALLVMKRGRDEDLLEYMHDDLKDDEEFLYEVDKLYNLDSDSEVFMYISERIQNKIEENPDYLSTVSHGLKPAKRN